jgi:hypothetical protein
MRGKMHCVALSAPYALTLAIDRPLKSLEKLGSCC